MNKEIKNIITNFKKKRTELSHSNIPNSNVEKVANNIDKLSKTIECLENFNKLNSPIKLPNSMSDFKIHKINGNGECFYSAIAYALNHNQKEMKIIIIQRINDYYKLEINGDTNSNKSYNSNSNNSENRRVKRISTLEELQRILTDTAINIINTTNNNTLKPYKYKNHNNLKKIFYYDPNLTKQIIINDITNTWGGAHVALLISFIFNITINIFNPLYSKTQKIRANTVNSDKEIYLYYNGRDHYDALVKK